MGIQSKKVQFWAILVSGNVRKIRLEKSRFPIIKSAAGLAQEMGNSPAMIFKHYRELVKPKDATTYWAILPQEQA